VAPLLQLDDTQHVSELRKPHSVVVTSLFLFNTSRFALQKSNINGKHANL
jgi:hypothetical protein